MVCKRRFVVTIISEDILLRILIANESFTTERDGWTHADTLAVPNSAKSDEVPILKRFSAKR